MKLFSILSWTDFTDMLLASRNAINHNAWKIALLWIEWAIEEGTFCARLNSGETKTTGLGDFKPLPQVTPSKTKLLAKCF